MNPNGWLNNSKPAVTPMIAKGTVSQMIRVFLMELKRTITSRIMSPKKTGTEAAMPA